MARISRPAWLGLVLLVTGFLAGNEQKVIAEDAERYDVVIYGGTSAGIAAAVQVRRMGGTVIVIEPSSRIGGLTTGGLGQTDIGNKAAIGGVAREFYRQIKTYYDNLDHWNWQDQDAYRSGGQTRNRADEDAMWTFEPKAALVVMEGRYEVRIAYTSNPNRATNVPVTVEHASGRSTVHVNQRKTPEHGAFGTVGRFDFTAGKSTIEIGNLGTDGHVIADAVQLLPVESD